MFDYDSYPYRLRTDDGFVETKVREQTVREALGPRHNVPGLFGFHGNRYQKHSTRTSQEDPLMSKARWQPSRGLRCDLAGAG